MSWIGSWSHWKLHGINDLSIEAFACLKWNSNIPIYALENSKYTIHSIRANALFLRILWIGNFQLQTKYTTVPSNEQATPADWWDVWSFWWTKGQPFFFFVCAFQFHAQRMTQIEIRIFTVNALIFCARFFSVIGHEELIQVRGLWIATYSSKKH